MFDDLYFVTRWLDRYRCALVEAILGAWITACERWQSGAFHIDRLRTWWIVVLYSISGFGILSHLLCHRWIHSCKNADKLVNELFQYDWAFFLFSYQQWYFYINRRDKAHEWKCQPEKFLSPELELHEILVGASSLLIVSILSGFVACYALNGGKGLTIYYGWNEYGWLWFALQFVAIFVYQVRVIFGI